MGSLPIAWLYQNKSIATTGTQDCRTGQVDLGHFHRACRRAPVSAASAPHHAFHVFTIWASANQDHAVGGPRDPHRDCRDHRVRCGSGLSGFGGVSAGCPVGSGSPTWTEKFLSPDPTCSSFPSFTKKEHLHLQSAHHEFSWTRGVASPSRTQHRQSAVIPSSVLQGPKLKRATRPTKLVQHHLFLSLSPREKRSNVRPVRWLMPLLLTACVRLTMRLGLK
ncbi:hypothetical protein QBC45DRAFT_219966 [Copromyces sp. CBS 386.78]|nr:hypothetical protein QBC45DRAFT_219966 [Copromyces sp. CBS 386.78]